MKTLANELHEKAIAPLITWASIRGNKTKLVTAYQQHDSSTTRQTIEAWINPEPARRRMPLMHSGLLLLHCAKQLRIYADLPKPETKTH